MKSLRMLRMVLKKTKADRLILIFVIIFLICALLLLLLEPGITTFGQALWYCYSVFSTCGFGDVVSTTVLGRIISIFLTILTILVVALVTGVIVAFYNNVVAMQYKASKAEILDKLEHLDELSKEELRDISERIKKIT